MAEYVASIEWSRSDTEAFTDNRYSRAHTWRFDGGITVAASSSPHVVPLPYSVEANVDPEEAFVASLSSCHMLWFLYLAGNSKRVVDSYRDNALGVMAKNAQGKLAMTEVILRPEIKFSGNNQPDQSEIDALHHQAHEQCFIANSVKTEIKIEPQ